MTVTAEDLPIAIVFGIIVALAMPAWMAFLDRRGIRDVVTEDKIHRTIMPRGGGVVLGVVWLLGVAVLAAMGRVTEPQAALFIGAPLVLLLLGAADDVVGLSPIVRLAIEVILAFVVAGAVAVGAASPWWAVLVAGTVWLTGLPNAVNMLDGLDGLAGGVSAIAALGMAALGASVGLPWLAAPALLLAGVTIGFLPFNWPRARVFMGDSGSLFLGGAIGCLGLGFVASTAPDVAVAAGIVAGVPILDATVTLLRRLRAGRPLMSSDLNHMYNLAAVRLGSPRSAVLLSWAAGLACAVAGYAWVVAPAWRLAIVAVVVAGAATMVMLSSAGTSDREDATSAT
jgi:UDP-GlcNAc:undecaprenyl-phosphate GlcNAc-1-phosphate transferase